jgi:tape measure domain-containing protein
MGGVKESMSDTDKKVVQMEFDNKNFEKNIAESSDSLSKFKKNLNFDGVSSGIDKVEVKLSGLKIAAITMIANISNRVTNLGINLIKSLSVDNIFAGWQKYSQKTVAVATMVAQNIKVAGKAITDESEKLKVIDTQLESLNWFADETSYSFTDMVSNIGKFTAAGQSLDTSTKAMEGIATWAALSGQNTATASQAMYQLAQAMSKGKVQLIDYKSIQNANMDTEEFRNTILDTAVSLGELTKAGDQFVTKTGKKFKSSEFTTYLNENWFTSDVLIKGLSKYSAAVDQIYEISKKEGITASEVIEKYGDTLDAFGLKAFKASQEARTFSDVISSIKDAVSTKWMTTAEYIFGGYKKAVALFSDLADELYDVFAESGNYRNDILKIWSDLSGRDDLFKHGGSDQGAFWNIFDSVIALKNLIKSAWNTIFPMSTMESYSDKVNDIGQKLKNITETFKNFTKRLQMSEDVSSKLSYVFQGLFSVLKIGLNLIKAIRFAVDPLYETVKELANMVLTRLAQMGVSIENFSNDTSFFQKVAEKLAVAISNIIEIINPKEVLSKIFEYLEKIVGEISKWNIIEKVTGYIKDFVSTLRESGGTQENFIKIMNGVRSILEIIIKTVLQSVKIIAKYVFPIIENLVTIVEKFLAIFSGIAIEFLGIVGDIFTSLNSYGSTKIGSSVLFEEINKFFSSIPKIINKLSPALKSFGKILSSVLSILFMIPKVLNSISISLTGQGIIETINGISEAISDSVSDVENSIKDFGSNKEEKSFSPFVVFVKGIISFLKGAIVLLGTTLKIVGNLLSIIGKGLQTIGDALNDAFDGEHNGALIKIAITMAVITLVVVSIRNAIYALQSLVFPISEVADSLSGALDGFSRKLTSEAFKNLATSMLEIAASLLIIAGIDTPDLIKATATVGIIVGILFLILNYTKTAAGITTQVGRASKTIGSGLRSILGQIKANLKNAASLKRSTEISASVISFGAAMVAIAGSMWILSKLSWDDILRGLVVFVSVFGMMILVSKLIGTSVPNLKKAYPGIMQSIILVVALKMFSSSIEKISKTLESLSSIPFGKLMGSVLAIEILLLTFIGILFAINKLSSKFKKIGNTISLILLLTSISLALIAFSLSMKILSAINFGSMMKSILGFYSVMAGFVLLGSLIDVGTSLKLLALSAVIATFGVALIPFSLGLKELGSVPFNSIVTSLIAVAGCFVILGIAGKVLWTVTPAIVLLAASMLLIGVGMMAAAISMTMFATSVDLFAAALKPLTEGIALMFETIGPAVVKGLIGSFQELLNGVRTLLPQILTLVGDILKSVIEIIMDQSADIAEAAMTLIDNLLQTLANHSESIFNSIFTVIQSLLDQLKDHGPEIGDDIANIVIGIFDDIGRNSQKILDHLFDAVKSIIVSLFNNIVPLLTLILRLLYASFKDITDALVTNAVQFAGLVAKVILVLVDTGLRLAVTLIGTISKSLVIFLGAIIQLAVTSAQALSDVLFEAIRSIVANIVLMMVKVARNLGPDIARAIKVLAASIWNGLIDAIKTGLPGDDNGMIHKWLESLKVNTEDDLNSIQDIANGSKVNEAVQKATESVSNVVKNTNSQLSKTLQDGLTETVSTVSDAINALNNTDPSIDIKVKMDTTDVTKKSSELQNELSSIGTDYTYTGELASATGSNIASADKSASLASGSSTTTTNNTTTTDSHDVINIYASDAEDINKALQNKSKMGKLALGQ